MFPDPYPQITLVEDLEGYVKVLDTADWRVILSDLQGTDGQPLDLTTASLALQIRPYHLPKLIVDSLSSEDDGLLVNDGPSITITSLARNRTWVAREETNLIADLMMLQDNTTTFITRIHFLVSPGYTRV